MTADSAPGAQRGQSSSRMLRLPVVAAMLGLSESTLRRGVMAGDIPSKRLGKIVLIPARWVDEFTAWDGGRVMTNHHDPVLTVEPVTDDMRRDHGLSPDARLALVEHFEDRDYVISTDNQCAQGIHAAACSWAEATGAAYRSAA